MRLRLGFQGTLLLGILATSAAMLVMVLYFTFAFADEVFAFGVNPQVERMVESPLETYPLLFKARRDLHQLRADLAAADPALAGERPDPEAARTRLAALCREDPYLLRAQLEAGGATSVIAVCPDRGAPDSLRQQTLERSLAGGGSLRLTFGMEERHFAAFQSAGETSRFYSRIAQTRDELRTAYAIAFAVVIGVWVVLGGGLAVYLTRRTTRRLGLLVDATEQVAAGDLDVSVQVGGDDEITDLARAFNVMVLDLAERRERILYLERISSWQEIARRLAHEIKNPLTPIQLAMQQLTSRYPGDDPKFARLLSEVDEIVREEVETLRRLVTEFSQFARLPDVAPEPTDLRAWLSDFFQKHPELTGPVRLDLDLPASPVWAPVDRVLLGRVVSNLVGNAIQAMDGLEPEGRRVQVRLVEEPRGARIRVQDSGPGIPDTDRSRIFEPYFTTKETGTGLGLPICKKIVLQHDGELRLVSSDAGGACFEIRLPPAAAQVVGAPSAA